MYIFGPNLKNKRVLVTGGAGFIGSHTVDTLLELGAKVTIIDNLVTGKHINHEAEFYELNIANPQIKQVYKNIKPDIIYHFAFNTLAPKSVENPIVDIDSIIGSINLLECIKKHGVEKILFASSTFLYGNTTNFPTLETELIKCVSPYSISKQTVENYFLFYKQAFKINCIIFRCSSIYGPRQTIGAMADYIHKLADGKQAGIWGDGTKTRDYVYIEDAVKANIMALKLPDNYPDPLFNISTGKQTTLNDVYTKIAKILNKEAKPIYYPDRVGELMIQSIDSSKIKKALDWESKISLEIGLKKTIEYYMTGVNNAR